MKNLPFSVRENGPNVHVDNDFPKTARIGLEHLLFDLVDRRYLGGWVSIVRELQKIGRLSPDDYSGALSEINERRAREDSSLILSELTWAKVLDFCERLYSHLATAKGYYWDNEFQEEIPRDAVQEYIEEELQRLFLEEHLAFDFSKGVVSRRGRKHSIEMVSRAQVVLGDPGLAKARTHYNKALGFFRDRSNPDFENVVKEAVCAVEAAGKVLFPDAGVKTLGELSKWLKTKRQDLVPKQIASIVDGLFSIRSGGEGVSHGETNGMIVTQEVAEYVLSICASQIIYFVDVAKNNDPEVPF